MVGGYTRIGEQNEIFQFASVGEVCQDLKYAGEETWLEIGDHNKIREHCSLHRGTVQDHGITKIGSHNLINGEYAYCALTVWSVIIIFLQTMLAWLVMFT